MDAEYLVLLHLVMKYCLIAYVLTERQKHLLASLLLYSSAFVVVCYAKVATSGLNKIMIYFFIISVSSSLSYKALLRE